MTTNENANPEHSATASFYETLVRGMPQTGVGMAQPLRDVINAALWMRDKGFCSELCERSSPDSATPDYCSCGWVRAYTLLDDLVEPQSATFAIADEAFRISGCTVGERFDAAMKVLRERNALRSEVSDYGREVAELRDQARRTDEALNELKDQLAREARGTSRSPF